MILHLNSRRTFGDLSVTLSAMAVYRGNGRLATQNRKMYKKERQVIQHLSLPLGGEALAPGEHKFAFCFTLPTHTAAYQFSDYGSVEHIGTRPRAAMSAQPLTLNELPVSAFASPALRMPIPLRSNTVPVYIINVPRTPASTVPRPFNSGCSAVSESLGVRCSWDSIADIAAEQDHTYSPSRLSTRHHSSPWPVCYASKSPYRPSVRSPTSAGSPLSSSNA